MTMVINGSGTITGLSAGGLPSATVTQATLATPVYSQGVPAFSAYQNSNQSALTSGTWTKIILQAKEFDTNSNFDNVTNYRFTPTIAGYYQINGTVSPATFTGTYFAIAIYKNGSIYKQGNNFSPNSLANATSTVSSIVYFNGSTDYIELYAVASSTPTIVSGIYSTYFNGSMIRGA